MGGVGPNPLRAHIPQPSLEAVVGIEILEVADLRVADFCCGLQPVVLGLLAPVGPVRYGDGAVVAVQRSIAWTVICFQLRVDRLVSF